MIDRNEPAQSLFWQIQVTVGWNSSGGVVWSLKGKQKHDRWQDVRNLDQGFLRLGHEPEGTISEGLQLVEEVIRSQTLPRDPS